MDETGTGSMEPAIRAAVYSDERMIYHKKGDIVAEWMSSSTMRHWINVGGFILCMEEVALVQKVRIKRTKADLTQEVLSGLEVVCGGEKVQINYSEENSRDHDYDAIWEEIGKMTGARQVL